MRAILVAALVAAPASGHGAPEEKCHTHACARRTCVTATCRERVREKMWRRLQRELSPGQRTMLRILRGCETRGLSYPANYRYRGAHDGAYQYLRSTWRRAGGWGSAADASPAEQDVRTARFYPSHPGEWQCPAPVVRG